jgi:hypothetical protein
MEDNSHCNSRLVYHYTVECNFKKILASGVILPATAGVLPPERPIVWFSTNPLWENTVKKGIPFKEDGFFFVETMGWAEFNSCGIPLYRIGVARETAPLRWRDLRELSLMWPTYASALVRVAKMEYAQSGEWRGTFDPVPVEKWVTVETYNVQAMRWQEYHEQPSFGRAA